MINRLLLEIIGSPGNDVVQACLLARKLTMEEMGYNGEPPLLKITSGVVNDKYKGEIAGIYEYSTQAVVIGVAKLQNLLSKKAKAPDEVIAALVVAEETTHYVQDRQGRLPHKVWADDTPEEHYKRPTEKEASLISIKIANKIFPQISFFRQV